MFDEKQFSFINKGKLPEAITYYLICNCLGYVVVEVVEQIGTPQKKFCTKQYQEHCEVNRSLIIDMNHMRDHSCRGIHRPEYVFC